MTPPAASQTGSSPHDAAESTLPVQLTSFIGREREVAEVRRLLGSTRLLTLTGAGGSGKTRLALEAAARVAREDGLPVAWVELAPLSSPELVPRQIGAALGIQEGARSTLDAVVELLRDRPLLLALDNCEHLVEECARLAELLLRSCPGVRILATSREALGIAGERAWLVPALSLPDDRQTEPREVEGATAVRLFVERARDIVPGFALTEGNAAAVARICRRLDGIPLAIELAAARVKVLAPEQIADRLGDAFRLLTGGRRTAVPRQQTLRATMDWSYGLLSDPERRLLERLSVFSGGCTIEAAEAVCADERVEAFEVLDLLSALVDKSLVAMHEHAETARYRLLETVRQYAAERLRESGEEDGWRRRHAEHFMALAEEAEPRLFGPEQGRWLARLAAEHDNFRAAIGFGMEHRERETTARLASALSRYLQQQGHLAEGRRWLEDALAAGALPPELRAKGLLGLGNVAIRQRRYAEGVAPLEESAALFRQVGNRVMTARALNAVGVAMSDRSDQGAAEALYQEAWELLRDVPTEKAHAGMVLNNLGTIALRRRDFARAEELYAERLALARELGDTAGEGSALNNLAATLYARGELRRAEGYLRQAFPCSLRAGNVYMAGLSLGFLAQVASALGDAERAARLYGAAEARFGSMGFHVGAPDREEYDRMRAAARDRLGEEAWERAWREGHAMTPEQVHAYALTVEEPAGAPEPSPSAPPPASSEPAADAAMQPTGVAAAEPEAAPALRVLALGPLEVYVGGEPIASAEWSHARPRELLLYLLSHPRGRTREQVGLVFWPDASAAQVKNSFHVLLHRLRKAVGRQDVVVLEDDHYRVNPELGAWFDAEVFEREMPAALRDLRAGGGAPERIEAALRLYRGDFLRDEAVGDWHLEIHDRLRRLYVDGLSALADLRAERGDHAGAIEALERLVRAEELREDAHRRLMLILARTGARDRAVRHYERLVRLLREELDAAPEPETAAVYDRIRRAEAV
jgi:predicted ATPase/DNA-binding SARP family transcriptional activator